jgi:hypothetical protein
MTDISATSPDDKVIIDNPPQKIFDHNVFVPPIPDGAAEKGEPFQLDCSISLKPSEEFAEWAQDNNITFALGFHDENNTPQIELPNSVAAVQFRLVWY